MLDKDYDTRPERRTALIAKELHRYNIDIAALQETRLEGQGQEQEKEYTFFWSGRVGEWTEEERQVLLLPSPTSLLAN